jgi:hypothetical protein
MWWGCEGWENLAILKAAEPGKMPVERLFCLVIAKRKTDISRLDPKHARIVADGTKDGAETGTSMEQALHFRSLGLNLHDSMIYQKFFWQRDGQKRQIF